MIHTVVLVIVIWWTESLNRLLIQVALYLLFSFCAEDKRIIRHQCILPVIIIILIHHLNGIVLLSLICAYSGRWRVDIATIMKCLVRWFRLLHIHQPKYFEFIVFYIISYILVAGSKKRSGISLKEIWCLVFKIITDIAPLSKSIVYGIIKVLRDKIPLRVWLISICLLAALR